MFNATVYDAVKMCYDKPSWQDLFSDSYVNIFDIHGNRICLYAICDNRGDFIAFDHVDREVDEDYTPMLIGITVDQMFALPIVSIRVNFDCWNHNRDSLDIVVDLDAFEKFNID